MTHRANQLCVDYTIAMESFPSVGAFYQCYKRPKSFLAALGSFRNVYPDSDVVLFSDGGFDYSHAARKFNCSYSRKSKRSGDGESTYFEDTSALLSWFDRLYHAALSIRQDYILLLEDDVRVLRRVQGLLFDVNGINENEKLGREMTSFLKKNGAAIPSKCDDYFYGGCGGALIRRSFILEKLAPKNIAPQISTLHPFAKEQQAKRRPSDYFLTSLTLLNGGTVGQYGGFCEKWRTSYFLRRYILRDIEVVHQEKSLYDKDIDSEEASILGNYQAQS